MPKIDYKKQYKALYTAQKAPKIVDVLNLLPIPGLDGFKIIEPFVPESAMKKIHEKGGLVILILMFLLFYDSPVNRGFWYLVGSIAHLAGLDINLVFTGYDLFKFWN